MYVCGWTSSRPLLADCTVHAISHRPFAPMFVAVLRRLAQRLMFLFWGGRVIDQPTKRCQVKHVCLHQGLSDVADIFYQSVEKIETHCFTDNHAQNLGVLFVWCKWIVYPWSVKYSQSTSSGKFSPTWYDVLLHTQHCTNCLLLDMGEILVELV